MESPERPDEQGDVTEPVAAGAPETPAPPADQLDREQQIVGEPLDESRERAGDASRPAGPESDVGPTDAPAERPTAGPVPAIEDEEELDEEPEPAPRVRPEIPGADLEVDIVREGEEALRGEEDEEEEGLSALDTTEEELTQPIADAAIDLASGARYRATGKRKTSVARVILKPGTGVYTINGRTLEVHFPRYTLQRQIRQPLETVGYEERMDVVATMHGGGVSAQAGALRHGISRALIEADPNLRAELKRRGFLTRDPRVKERKKAGLKKARKRPQFSKR
jgi:small subunit ribosomal protein S9